MRYTIQIETTQIYALEIEAPDGADRATLEDSAWAVWDGPDKTKRQWIEAGDTSITMITPEA